MYIYIVVPHITDAIQDWVTKVSGEPVEKTTQADVCLIEVSIRVTKILLFLYSYKENSLECFFFYGGNQHLEISSGTVFSKLMVGEEGTVLLAFHVIKWLIGVEKN